MQTIIKTPIELVGRGLDPPAGEWRKKLWRESHEPNLEIAPRMGRALARLLGDHPEWLGKWTSFLPGHGTTLFIEGVSFEIVEEVTPA